MGNSKMIGLFQLFQQAGTDLVLLENGERTAHKQAEHTDDTVYLLSIDLQKTLVNLTHSLFGKGK